MGSDRMGRRGTWGPGVPALPPPNHLYLVSFLSELLFVLSPQSSRSLHHALDTDTCGVKSSPPACLLTQAPLAASPTPSPLSYWPQAGRAAQAPCHLLPNVPTLTPAPLINRVFRTPTMLKPWPGSLTQGRGREGMRGEGGLPSLGTSDETYEYRLCNNNSPFQ